MASKAERAARQKEREENQKQKELEEWIPKTALGKKAKNSEISSPGEVLESNAPILEPQIIDFLLPDMQEKMVDFKKTTKVRRAGRKFSFRAAVLVGDGREYVGLGVASDKEKWPALRKASKLAKLNLVKARKGCGSWECACGVGHSLPFAVEGKSASVRVKLLPAPNGVGLVAGDNIKDILRFVGLRDVWVQTRGSTGTKLNFVRATIDALKQTTKRKGMESGKEEKVK